MGRFVGGNTILADARENDCAVLYAEIIRSMNADVSPTTRLHELECTAVNMLAHASPRMLLIDEIHNLLSCSARDQRGSTECVHEFPTRRGHGIPPENYFARSFASCHSPVNDGGMAVGSSL